MEQIKTAEQAGNTALESYSETDSPKVSVIVPVHKVEKYLPECIDSILAQTFTDFELILVDDGSPDSSGKICDDYASRDSRIRVFHKENGGVSSARNLGMDNARGEWIMFVDSDDTIDRDMLSTLFQPIESGGGQVVVVCSSLSYEFLFSPERNHLRKKQYSRVFFRQDEIPLFFDENNFFTECDGGACAKLFSQRLLRESRVRFMENNAAYEDTLFTFHAVINSCGVYCVSGATYHYLHRSENSLSTKRHPFENLLRSGDLGLKIWEHYVRKKSFVPPGIQQKGYVKFLGIYLYSLFSLYKFPREVSFKERISIIALNRNQVRLKSIPLTAWKDFRMRIVVLLLSFPVPYVVLDFLFIVFWCRKVV